MVTVKYINTNELPVVSKTSQESGPLDDVCEFSYNPKDECTNTSNEIDSEHTEAEKIGKWNCPFPKYKQGDKCIFHTSVDEKEPAHVAERLEYYLNNPPKSGNNFQVVGADFPKIDLRYLSTVSCEKIEFLYSTFHSPVGIYKCKLPKIDVTGSDFEEPLYIKNSNIDGVVAIESRFLDNERGMSVFFDNSSTSDGLKFDYSTFIGEFIISKTNVDGEIQSCSCVFTKGVDLYGSGITGEVDFTNSNILGSISSREQTSIRFQDCVFQKRLILRRVYLSKSVVGSMSQCNGEFMLTNSTLPQYVKLTGCEFEEKVTMIGMYVSDTVVDLRESYINSIDTYGTRSNEGSPVQLIVNISSGLVESGRVFQPRNGEVYCIFDLAEVGDVDFRYRQERLGREAFIVNPLLFLSDPNPDESIFRLNSFVGAKFSGFDFANYKQDLRKSDWQIHPETEKRIPEEYEITERRPRSNEQQRKISINTNPYSHNILEKTYLSARNAADASGDSESASEFLIKEFAYRRKGHWKSNRYFKWLFNWMLFLTSGYGERTSRVVITSVIVVISFSLTYLEFFYRSGEFVERLVNSSILSIQSFATLVVGSQNELTQSSIRLLTAVEGFLGAFLIALFVFTLTKTVRH